jgi:DNA-binding transcriptional regulator GbsR (MarR family)
MNRTVAQVHALLHVSATPLTAEEIATTLSVARSNVSTSLRELQGWSLVRTVHVLGDRRQHYDSIKDVWEMFRIIIDQRKRREIDPTLDVLRQCIAELTPRPGEGGRHAESGAHADHAADRYTRERLQEIYDFLTTNDKFISKLSDYDKMQKYISKISENYARDRVISKEEFLKDQELWEELITNYNLDLDLFGFTNGVSFIDSYGIESKLKQLEQLSYESIDMLEHKKLYFIQ